MLKRIDHPYVAVPSSAIAAKPLERILALKEFDQGPAAQADRGFHSTWFLSGDGFLGLVEPFGEADRLHAFLARKGPGYYACALEVDDMDGMVAHLERHETPMEVWRDPKTGVPTNAWISPRATKGPLFVLLREGSAPAGGLDPKAGGNPHLLGIVDVVVAAHSASERAALYPSLFLGLGNPEPVEEPGLRGFAFSMTSGDRLIVAEPSGPDSRLHSYLERRGEGLYRMTWLVDDLEAVVSHAEQNGGVMERSAQHGSSNASLEIASLGGAVLQLRQSR